MDERMKQTNDTPESVSVQSSTEDQIQEEAERFGLRDALKWYFSPYLTTLITAPMLLVLVGVGALCVMAVIVRSFLLIVRYPILLLVGIPGIPLSGIHLFIIYWTLMGIPRIWRKGEWGVLKRLLAISGAFVGTLVAAYVIEQIEVAIFKALVGESWPVW